MAPNKTKTDITLYTLGTANGIKISILLEALGLDYSYQRIDISRNVQKEPWFLEINPNGRVPAITDRDANGELIRVFESGAIMQYLVHRYDKNHTTSFPHDTKEHWEMTSWLMWQMSGLGPMQGQANHFKRYAPVKIQYGIDRYVHESRRLLRTMEDHLAKSPSGFLVGDKCTIADIACWGWVVSAPFTGIDLKQYPHLDKWVHKCLAVPGFETGRHIPTPHTALEWANKTDEEHDAEAAKNSGWIQKGMQEDAAAK